MAQSNRVQEVSTIVQFLKDLRKAIRSLSKASKTWFYWFLDFIDPFVDLVFHINLRGRIIRSFLFPIGFFLWMGIAYTAHPPQTANLEPWISFGPAEDFRTQLMFGTLVQLQIIVKLLLALVEPFFQPDILRHVLVIGLAFWVAFRIASIYLDDIFELGDVSIAASFIRIASFVGRYPRVQLRNGEIPPKFRDSPVFKIGGPGKVMAQYENVALFEKIDGQPRVIFPEDGYLELEGFERLREIFDLRDQFVDSQVVKSRTKDGIKVTAKNINMVFSIHRGDKPDLEKKKAGLETRSKGNGSGNESSPEEPHLYFDKEAVLQAVKNLTYQQPKRPWTRGAISSITSKLRGFIGKRTLDEFLANVSPQELATIRQNIQAQSPGQPTEGLSLDISTISKFLARTDITATMQGTPEEGKKRGFDVHWVGVGTWDTPEISEKHLEAWEMTVRNRIEGNNYVLAQIRHKSRLDELRRLIQDVPINAFGLLQNRDRLVPSEIKYKLMLAYREKLKNALDLYEDKKQDPPVELVETVNFLNTL